MGKRAAGRVARAHPARLHAALPPAQPPSVGGPMDVRPGPTCQAGSHGPRSEGDLSQHLARTRRSWRPCGGWGHTRTHAPTQTLCPPHPDPATGFPKPRATDHTSLYSVQSRAGGQGPSFSGCVRRCSIGGTQTGPQSANKLGGKFSGCCRAGARWGVKWAPPEPLPVAQLSPPRKAGSRQHAS